MAATAEALPYVDEHAIDVEAPPQSTWEALLAVIGGSFASPRTRQGARLLGCEQTEVTGPRPLTEGSTVPGFRVARAERARRLDLVGRHRFSRYALVFHLDPGERGGTTIRAETRAAFPGVHGRLYRAAVIGSRAHRLVTRRLLRAVARRAER